MRFLVRRCGKLPKFFWVHFILALFYLHCCLARIDNLSETECGAPCVTGGAVLIFFVLILEPPKMACDAFLVHSVCRWLIVFLYCSKFGTSIGLLIQFKFWLDEHREDGKSINKANKYRADCEFQTIALSWIWLKGLGMYSFNKYEFHHVSFSIPINKANGNLLEYDHKGKQGFQFLISDFYVLYGIFLNKWNDASIFCVQFFFFYFNTPL